MAIWTRPSRWCAPIFCKHGNQVEAMRLLARIGIARKVFDDAELLLAAILELAPEYRAARQEYAERAHRTPPVSRRRAGSSTGCCAEEPDNRLSTGRSMPRLPSDLASTNAPLALPGAAARDARRCGLHLSIAHALKTLGQREEAIESYRRAAACRPNFGDAYWSLANLKTYRFTDEELARLRAAEGGAVDHEHVDRYHLCFALGKALEDRGEFAESFHYYALGNALKRTESKYRPEIIENNTRQQIEVCTARVLRQPPRLRCDGSGSDFHRRPAALGFDPARTDPGFALAGRGHAGTRQHPADRRQSSGP